MSEFDRKEDAVGHIAQSIGHDFDSKDAAMLVAQACAGDLVAKDTTGGDQTLRPPGVRWVIRDDDLKLWDTFFKAAGAAVGVLAALFAVVRAIWKKGISLTEEQHVVLMALHNHGSRVTTEALAGILGWDVERTKAVLNALTKMPCADGTVVAVVGQDGHGLWATAGV
jgi:hypothetical protein